MRRLVAGLIDIGFGLVLCHFLRNYFGHYFAARSVVTFHIGSPTTIWKGTIPWLMAMFSLFVYTLPLALFLAFLPEAIWGRGLGKFLLGLRIEGSPKKLWLRYLLKTTMFWGMTLGLILGSWQVLVLAIVMGAIVLLAGLPSRACQVSS